jgi:asparagine synthetase B (glutamine-hydrolysing)
VRQNRLAFAQGRDILTARSGKNAHDLFREIAELADHNPSRLVSLPGDFGFIRFRPEGAATVVRSCGGLVPFYLWQSAQRTAISTCLGDFVRYLPDEPRLDPLVNAVWASGHGFFPDGRTFLAGVSILDRGCFALVEQGREVEIGRYWNPRPKSLARPTPTRAREHAERLRSILIDKLVRDLDPEEGNLLTLSGGVDSASLGALASGVVGRKVWTLSFLPVPEELFEHEMSYIRPLASRYGFERNWSIRMHAETKTELLHAAPRIVFHVVHPALCALPSIKREAQVRVLFGGEFADEVCGSHATIPDWASHTSLLRLIAGLGKLPSGPRDVLRWGKHRLLSATGQPALTLPENLPDFFHPEIRDEYHSWLERRRREVAHDNGPLRYLTLRAEADGFVAMNWEAASALGVRRSFPFFNREMLELAFECHPAERVGPGTKKLLRTALLGDVPQKNLMRPDKGGWGYYLRDVRLPWQTPLPEALETIVRSEWYPMPPESLERWDACGLLQLMVFLDSLTATRRRSDDLRLEAKL